MFLSYFLRLAKAKAFEVSVFLRKTETSNGFQNMPKAKALDSKKCAFLKSLLIYNPCSYVLGYFLRPANCLKISLIKL
jgi:hypothetical protein